MKITVPDPSLVLLIGASGSGKSVFARDHFKPTEVLSSDSCRGLVSDDENDQSATKDAFDLLRFIAAKRLAAGRLTVIDATNVQQDARKPLLALAREYHVLCIAIVFNIPEKLCQERNHDRPNRDFGPHVVRRQSQHLRRSLKGLRREGFLQAFVLNSPDEVDDVSVEREPLRPDRRNQCGPFDIIGDVHGCLDELVALLSELGYEITSEPADPAGARYVVRPPEGRKAVFLGDLVDRGPDTPGVLRLVMSMVESGNALSVPGNHDMKLLRKLKGTDVKITHGLAQSLAQLEREPAEFTEKAIEFLDRLVSHYVLDDGNLVVAHAGMRAEMQGRASRKVRDFALYGETTGETDEFGLPIRYDWAKEYRGKAIVVYGHTPAIEARWLNRTINIDAGCVFGGKLAALRYPEKELVSVSAAREYYEPAKPLVPDGQAPPAKPHEYDDLLDVTDVIGKRIITTRLRGKVTIREENAAAALEVMTRFAVDPKWLIYLPPTMSPPETSNEQDLLEHPAEAFSYYRHQGMDRVLCEEKHMGSRAVVVVCRNEDVARDQFRVVDGALGICYTRTGRRFFEDRDREDEVLARVLSAVDAAGMWSEFDTEWVCLDCEIMPWSAKAKALVIKQYAAVGASSRAALAEAIATLEQAAPRENAAVPLLERYRSRAEMATQYVDAYRPYCWAVGSVSDLKVAPFHLMATEGAVHVNRDHVWHMKVLEKLCRTDHELLLATAHKVVDVTQPESLDDGVRWWEELTARGSEGMVVKPLDFIARGRRGLVQPAMKCRGREYLRIIYGPEYTAPEHLERLRDRSLARKRSLALREFALGIEALERFVRREPLYSVHECVFGILALESEPVDPRL